MIKGRLRFGICGLGWAGSGLMAPAMKRHPNAVIAAACDSNPDTCAAFGADYAVPTFPTLQAMLDGAELDAVYIATPHHLHCEQVIQVAERGLHVIVEKPMTLADEDGRRIVDAVKQHGVQLVVGTSRSHDPVVATMRGIIARGEVGRLAMVNCWNYTDFLYRPRRPEDLDTSRGGGIIFNQLSHQIDIIKALADASVVSVRAGAGRLDPKRPTEGHCAAFLTLSNGVFATLAYSGYDHFDSDELQFWTSESGREKKPNHGGARKVLAGIAPGGEAKFRTQRFGYGGPMARSYAATDLDRNLEEVYRTPLVGGGFVSNGNTHHDLGFVTADGPAGRSRNAKPGQLNHLGFEMGTEAEMVADYERAVAGGQTFLRTSDHDISHSIYGADPDGNTYELYADVVYDWRNQRSGTITKAKPNWTPGSTPPVAIPMYEDAPELRRVESALFHTSRCAGATLVVADLAASIRHYTEVVGLTCFRPGQMGRSPWRRTGRACRRHLPACHARLRAFRHD